MISDRDVIVYGKNPTNGSSDVYLILPIDDIRDDYIAVSHRPTGQFTSYIGIVATEASATVTEIDITVPHLGRNISLRIGEYHCDEGQTLTVQLAAYETVQLESNQDLMGVAVTSSHPVALITADTTIVKLNNGTTVVNHFGNQMIPTGKWGKKFIAASTVAVAGPRSVNHDMYHILGKNIYLFLIIMDNRKFLFLRTEVTNSSVLYFR